MLSRLKFFKKFDIKTLVILTMIVSTIVIMSKHNSQQKETKVQTNNLIENIYLKKTIKNIFDQLEPKYKKVEHTVLKGENLDRILIENSIRKEEITLIKKELSEHFDTRKLLVGTKIEFLIEQSKKEIINFTFPVSKTKKIFLTKKLNENFFKSEIKNLKLNKKILFNENKIYNSLYKSAIDVKIPAKVIIEFARIYGFQIDFQRDIKKNDSFQIMYEIFLNDKNKIIDTGEILYANLNIEGIDNSLYLFKDKDNYGHYDKNGKSIKKTLMKTPINGARLSSSFGMRKHPIDGFNKMHRGTDFAAPLGTPIMASGDGVVIKAGWCGGGGNCVKIKHNSIYTTVYAHMSKFANMIKRGKRVRQGQTIGYVGSTGKSTGPHLHYEVIVNGKRVNSQKLNLPSGKILKGQKRILFETEKIKLDVLKSEKIIGLS
ncbi:Peptidase family M23 [alpha proteobacterium HIMB5]|nr:Peptidase family M23 [alpha proteobacterium HIMB5]